MWFSNTIKDTSCVQDTGLSPHPAGFKCSREEPRQEADKTHAVKCRVDSGTPSSPTTGEGDACYSPGLMTFTQRGLQCPRPPPP